MPLPGNDSETLPGSLAQKLPGRFFHGLVHTRSTASTQHRFSAVVDAFLAQPGLPFASLLSAERIERIFAKHDALFGMHGVYNTAVMLWSFLGQVLRDVKESAIAFWLETCHPLLTRVTIAELELNFRSPRSENSRAKWPKKLKPMPPTPGCGRDGMQNSSTVLRSPCPTRCAISHGTRSRKLKSLELASRLLERSAFCRWQRPRLWTWPLLPMRERKPAKRLCSGPFRKRFPPTTSRFWIATTVR